MTKKTFKELQKIVMSEDVYIFYDNDYFEITKYPMDMELTEEQDKECIIVHSDDIDFSTFPEHQLYGNGIYYGNGIMVLLANTPNHKVKGVRVA